MMEQGFLRGTYGANALVTFRSYCQGIGASPSWPSTLAHHDFERTGHFGNYEARESTRSFYSASEWSNACRQVQQFVALGETGLYSAYPSIPLINSSLTEYYRCISNKHIRAGVLHKVAERSRQGFLLDPKGPAEAFRQGGQPPDSVRLHSSGCAHAGIPATNQA